MNMGEFCQSNKIGSIKQVQIPYSAIYIVLYVQKIAITFFKNMY
jgi:hypothetical protein